MLNRPVAILALSPTLLFACAGSKPTPPDKTAVYADQLEPSADPVPVEKVSVATPKADEAGAGGGAQLSETGGAPTASESAAGGSAAGGSPGAGGAPLATGGAKASSGGAANSIPKGSGGSKK